jgi:hypothetical protein
MPASFTVVADERETIHDVYDALTKQGLAPTEPRPYGRRQFALTVSGSARDLSERICNATFGDCTMFPTTPEEDENNECPDDDYSSPNR